MDDFWSRFAMYVRSYLPDWQYQRGGPEPESALMTVLGEMLEESRQRLEKLPEKHRREYLSAWDGAPRGREPMYAYAMLSAPKSTPVPKGSTYYRSGNGTKLWETAEDARAEAAQLTDQVFSGGNCGKLIHAPAPTDGAPTRLFDFRLPGTQKREVRFRHPFAFTSQLGCRVSLLLEDAPDDLLQFFSNPAMCSWYLETEERRISLDTPALDRGVLSLHLPTAGEAKALLACAGDGAVPPPAPIRRALVGTTRAPAEQVLVLTDSGPCSDRVWLPFGPRLMQWNTCYLSCPDALCLPGAQVTLSWLQSFQVREELLPGMDQTPEYRPVMRRLPKAPPAVRDIRADRVLWEYWNGVTWRAIPGTEDFTRIFSGLDEAGNQAKRLEVRFCWPEDAQSCAVQGVNGWWLRWRLSACEGAGWLPARYHAPELSQLQIAADLCGAEAAIEQRCGMGRDFIPLSVPSGKVLFPAFISDLDSWWLGFDAPPSGDTLHLHLSLQGRERGGLLSASEASPGGGEHPLSLLDQTDGLSHSGRISLYGLQGNMTARFGMTRWWLCLREETGIFRRAGGTPVLLRLACGAVLLKAAGDCCAAGETFTPLHGGTTVGTSLSDSFGGTPEESDGEILERLQMERHHLGRIVSASDAEQLICSRVRDVARIRCVRSGDTLQVGVLMRDVTHHAAAFQLRQREIREILSACSVLPALGLSPAVREPCFYPIHVMAWISLGPGDSFAGIQSQLKQALNRFLDPVSGHFSGGGWRIGELPALIQIRTCLQSAVPDLSLMECVASAATPEGNERDTASIRDPFALPLAGTYTIFSV